MEARIRQLAAMIENAEIVEGTDGDVVEPGVGRRAPLRGRRPTPSTYFFGSVEERGIEHDIISPGSPLGKALARQEARRQGRLRVPHRRHPHRRGRRHLVTLERRGALAACRADRSTLPGRGTTFVRHHPAPAGCADRAAPPRHRRHGRRQLVHGLPGAGRAVRRRGHRPPWPRPGHPLAGAGHARRLRRRRRRRARRARASSGRSPSATRWAGRSPSSRWHRHRDRVAGLVLCATAHRFQRPRADARLRARPRHAQLGHGHRARCAGPASTPTSGAGSCRELRSTDQRKAMQAGFSLARFDSSAWLGDVDVPHAVVLTDARRCRPARRASSASPTRCPRPPCVRCESDHSGCVTRPDRFVPALVEALDAVTA